MVRLARFAPAIILSLVATAAAAEPPPVPVVRVLSPRLEQTLVDAVRLSLSLRTILHELERTDLIVHVTGRSVDTPMRFAGRRLAGSMRFVTATPTRRFLRVTVDESLSPSTRAAVVAHELWHPLEVARAPHVRDRDAFKAHYQHVGHSPSGNPSWYDTKGAVAAGARVLLEILRKGEDR